MTAARRLKTTDLLAIGDVARRTGLNVSAIRFYEDQRLIEPVRSGGNQRRFLRSDIRRLSFILIAQKLGLGLTEIEARAAHGEGLTVLRAEFGGNDRAIAERKGKGLVKVMVVKGRPVGASIVGPQAGELIGFWALAIATGVKLGTLAGLVLPYPTLGETAKRASGAYFSAKLFDNPALKRVVRLVQRFVP